MIGIEVHAQHRAAAQIVELEHRRGAGFPGRVQIPTPTLGVIGDVVAQRLPRGDARPPLVGAVVKLHRRGDHQMAAQFVGQGGGHLDAQAARLLDADGFIATGLARLAVGGEKHPQPIPALAPLLFGHAGGVEVVAVAPQPFPTHGDRRPSRRQRLLGDRESPPQRPPGGGSW